MIQTLKRDSNKEIQVHKVNTNNCLNYKILAIILYLMCALLEYEYDSYKYWDN